MTQDEAQEKLEEFRLKIDVIDRQIVELLNSRTRVVEEIGQVKREAQLPIYEPKREELVFANITSCNQGPITAAGLRRIFERIIDEMRTIQRLRMTAAQGDKK
ncbi:MAG TPA: chorismate mutase [Verrucomicrobiae bacterium]|nr:chorismate mutase [Verrucomicrobiae bacterium]